jgi:hypothetical protein
MSFKPTPKGHLASAMVSYRTILPSFERWVCMDPSTWVGSYLYTHQVVVGMKSFKDMSYLTHTFYLDHFFEKDE